MTSTELNPSDHLKALIHAGSALVGTAKNRTEDSVKTLDNVVASRLREFSHVASSAPDVELPLDTIENHSLDELKLLTAQKSLDVLERVQSLLQEYDADLPESNKESATPQVAVGTRDLGVLRTLASVVFGWGTTPSLVAFYSVTSAEPPIPPEPPEATTTLKSILKRISSMLWLNVNPETGKPSSARLFPSHITKILITAHITDLLRVGISLGWAPEPDKESREIVFELLKILPASQAIVSLGAVGQPVRSDVGTSPVQVPIYVQKASSGLLSRQVLRPDGVSGLCAAVFGEGEEVAPLVKLERIARVLGAVPSQMDREAYMRTIIPRLINLLGPVSAEFQSQSVPTSYKQAAAFTLARMLTTSRPLTLKIISPILHARFLPVHTGASPEPPSLSAEDAIATLTTLFTSTDPSPLLAQVILEPILVPLYNLSAHLDAQRVSDPMLKESTRGLIRTWARLVGREEAVTGLWNIVLGASGWGVGEERKWSWDVGEEGLEIAKAGPPKPIPLSVLQGPDEGGELGDEEDDNPLSLRPNPKHFSELVKTLERKDVASAVFVKTLNAYQAAKAVDTEPLKVLLYLRLILEMQQRMGSSVFTEPEHVLQFVAHAIEPREAEEKLTQGSGMDALRIVEDDSDDEHEQEEPGTKDDMVLTAVTLLLSILEANEKLSTTASPLLAMIFDYLEPITNSEDEALRALAREARLVLISRRSLLEAMPTSTDAQLPQLETYQEALRLIQDPILPVRAHGLHMLRQLVVPSNPTKGLPELNPALVPGILDVFLQSVQEEDSFVFLNAVQGLSAMVNRIGREILQNLVRIYADGVEPGRSMERAELDKRVRIGEAFVQVVRSCGNALGLYVDMLVPPLFRVVRTDALPTVLRSSALAILAQCVETSPLALTAWRDELMSGMLDIIQLESVQAVPLSRKAREEVRAKQEEDKQKLDESVDSSPQDADSKLPPLRRSALLCFALIVRSMVEGIYEGAQPIQLGGLRSRALTLLEYVRVTDSDAVVRTQAAETLALVKQLGRAELGLDV